MREVIKNHVELANKYSDSRDAVREMAEALGLNVTELVVLALLDEPQTATELSLVAPFERSGVSKALSSLKVLGLVALISSSNKGAIYDRTAGCAKKLKQLWGE